MENTSVLAGLIFFLAFAGLILIHELGHYLASIGSGVEVEEFGFGLPPKMLTLFHWKGTEFTLNWIPLGGFVRPKGENDPNVQGGLAAASPWRRLGVLFAGPVMNLLAGFLIFLFLVRADGYHDLGRVMLAEIAPNSPAESSGMRVGDVVVQAAGQPVTDFDTLSGIIRSHLEQPVDFVLQRGEETLTVTATPRSNPPEGQGAIGIRMSEVVIPVNTWGATVRYAATSVYDQGRALLLLPAKLIRGTLAPEEGRFIGLKGIFDIFNLTVSTDVQSRETLPSTAQAPTYSTLYLIATLTISIGLFNLLPFPALDGGRILFVIPELITRRRVPHQFENAVHATGMILLLLFMLYINVMDFVNPIVLPTP
jgi:regulator of sigma E protease